MSQDWNVLQDAHGEDIDGVTHSTGAPQGALLSPVLFTLTL